MKALDLNNICSPEKQQHIQEFADYCCDKLGIDRPELTLKGTNDTNALGYTDMSDGSVTIVIANRHQMDIMRTLAHELVHCKQMTSHEPDGATGSADENEANAMAGVLMREWGQQNPDLFTEGENVEENSRPRANYNPDGDTYRGKRMPSLDKDDPNNMAQDIDSFDDNEFAYDPETDQSIDDDNRNKKMANILKGLTPKEQEILKMRYEDNMSLRQIGKKFNVSGERIRHIEMKALRKLRHPSRSGPLEPYTEETGKTSRGHELRKNRFFGGDNRGYTHDHRAKNAILKKLDKNIPDDPDEKKITLRKKINDLIHKKELEKDYWDDYSFAEAKSKMSAQDRFNKRLKDKHGIDLEDREKFYSDMKKKFQQSLADREKADEGTRCWKGYKKDGTKEMFGKRVPNCVKAEEQTDLEESKTAKMIALITALGATYGLEDEAKAFADQIKQNIHNAQNAEPNPGRPDPVSKGNPLPGSDRIMRPPVDEKAPPGREKQVKKLKKKFDDPGAPYAIAWAQHNKHGKPTKEERLKEIKKRQMMIRQQIQEIAEAKKDACYHKVRSRYKVWPSAYASGALVQCRKKGAKNWGNKSK